MSDPAVPLLPQFIYFPSSLTSPAPSVPFSCFETPAASDLSQVPISLISAALCVDRRRVPPPSGRREGPLRILLFDAYHDEYRGVICLIEVIDGEVREAAPPSPPPHTYKNSPSLSCEGPARKNLSCAAVKVKNGDKITAASTGENYEIQEVMPILCPSPLCFCPSSLLLHPFLLSPLSPYPPLVRGAFVAVKKDGRAEQNSLTCRFWLIPCLSLGY